MSSQCVHILGIMLSIIGWLGTIICCGVPKWKVTTFIGCGIVSNPIILEGLWMNCIVQITGQMHCRVYDSNLAISQDLQASRSMVIISIVVGVFGFLMTVVGGKCTNCLENEAAKARACIVSGVVLIIAGILILVPACWSAHALIKDFGNPLIRSDQKQEMGACLYIGWGSGGFLMLGGGLLCWNCPSNDNRPYITAKYTPGRSPTQAVDYV